MSNLFYLPRVYSQPGAKLYFRATGTSTPQPTYQDFARATPHANPVVADSDGYFAAIYLDPSLPNYRVIHTAGGNAGNDPTEEVLLEPTLDNVPSRQTESRDYRLKSDIPKLIFEETDQSDDNQKWLILANGNSLRIAPLDGSEVVITGGLSIARDGTVSALGDLSVTGDVTADNGMLYACKTGTTGKSLDTALAADADLVVEIPSAGFYAVDALLRLGGDGSGGAGGFKRRVVFSGTPDPTNGGGIGGASYVNGSGAQLAMTALSTTVSYAAVASAVVTGDYERLSGFLHADSAGDITIEWAQNSSNANATRLAAGSYVMARKIGPAA